MTTKQEHESRYPPPDFWEQKRPDWTKWEKIRSTALWKAVVLACGLDPINFQLPRSEQRAGPWRELPKEASSLLTKALANMGGGFLKTIEPEKACTEDSEVDLENFTAWLDSFQHPLPEGYPWVPEITDFTQLVWPWGRHSTLLLRRLAEVGVATWKRYDSADPTTAPRNEEVIRWLVGHDVSENLAKAMATILRADGLKTGPRK